MLKVRLIIGALLVALLVGYEVLWQTTGFATDDKLVLGILFWIPFISLCILMAITFFTLDERGQIPRGSLAYRYFAFFYRETKTTDEGERVTIEGAPDKLRLCPAFWMIFMGVVMVTGLIMLGSVFLPLLISAVLNAEGARDDLVMLSFVMLACVAFMAGILVLMFGIPFLIARGLIGKILAGLVALGFLGLISLAFYVIPPHLLSDVSAGEARQEVVIATGIVAGGIGLFIVGLIAVVFLSIWLFPWARNSLVGRLVAATYHKACPRIPIEPAESNV